MDWPNTLFTLPTAPKDVLFRPAALDEAARIHATCYPERPFPHFQIQFARRLAYQNQGKGLWLIGEREVSLLGSGQLVFRGAQGEIADVFVVPDARSQGIGSALVTILTDAARVIGIVDLEIGALSNNVAALTLYQRLGFELDRQVRLTNGNEAVILHRKL